MGPYSMDLRERVAAAVDDGEGSQREIARLFRVSLSFVSRLLKRRREAGTLAPEPHGGGPTSVLSPDAKQQLEDLVREHNDDTLEQLRQRGGFREAQAARQRQNLADTCGQSVPRSVQSGSLCGFRVGCARGRAAIEPSRHRSGSC